SSKGVSFEEKRNRLLAVFHESCEVYQLKELEKIGPKKGITSQSVKDVVQSLVDDNLIVTDKIGVSNYYWSFPSEAIRSVSSINRQSIIGQLTNDINKESKGRDPSNKRTELLNQLKEVIDKQKKLSAELKQRHNSTKSAKVAKDAANRWTDNIWAIQSYCTNHLSMDKQNFNQAFNITDEFDYID
ncbi:meiotic nuclear division protein 1, partial [Cunninghamella echinulata]